MEQEQMLITEVVESEPMKGTLGKTKYVGLTITDDEVIVGLPKGVTLIGNSPLPTGTLVMLWVPSSSNQGVNGR